MLQRDRDTVVSVVMAGRDDNYGNLSEVGIRDLAFTPIPYIDRLANSIEKFDDGFKHHGIPAEIVIVDWSPSSLLLDNSTISNICQGKNVKFVVVTKSMVRKMKFNPSGFDEFFAKNIGIRSAIGRYLLLTNSDAWPDSELFASIASFINSDFSTFYGRPFNRIDLDSTNSPSGEGLTFNYNDIDGTLGTAAAGDFVLTHRTNILSVGGYNEAGTRKSTKTRQAGIDGQLLMNLYLQGIHPKKMAGSVLTYDHNKIQRNDYGVPRESCLNKSTWGLSNVAKEFLTDNALIVNHVTLKTRCQRIHSALIRKFSTVIFMLKIHRARSLR